MTKAKKNLASIATIAEDLATVEEQKAAYEAEQAQLAEEEANARPLQVVPDAQSKTEGNNREATTSDETPVDEEAAKGTNPENPENASQPAKGGSAKKSKAKVIQWKRPTANLGSRVPPEAINMLDDLHDCRLKEWRAAGREGPKPTKQGLALEMVEDFLRKHKLLK